MNHTVLLTGATGLFGTAFLRKTKTNRHSTVIGICRTVPKDDGAETYIPADIRDKKTVRRIITEIRPECIVHAASIGNVDICQRQKKEAWATNVLGTRYVLESAKLVGAGVIFLSTNAVYDGKRPPFAERSPRQPLDYYGKTKVTSENEIQSRRARAVIVRLMTMYGWHRPEQRKNPVTWMIESLENRQHLRVVNDIYNNHLYVSQAVDSVLAIIAKQPWGESYNIAGRDCISRYQLALAVADVFGFDTTRIAPVSSDAFKTLAPRPKNTCFATDTMVRELGIVPLGVREGLTMMKTHQYASR